MCSNGDTSHCCEIAAHARVREILVDLNTGEFVLIPERASGTRHWEGVPTALTVRLTHVEILAVVRISRKAGGALGQVVAQGTLLCVKYRNRSGCSTGNTSLCEV